ncbi:aspartyl protease family protein [Sphingomonas sp. BIUV-7]|uniref:Aspartyl protease family protein n=1 Tax=Sphingomonas natans TaxID=3063330 RepID=A0ABT8Y5N1_9SPHN|nr:aspartyl protease family protein [Sphingomonas sp. BIUV-7]MDO6413024.1 aspartyl protease family protein [Sphingomonas sp. BIUV-7]
MAVHAFALWLAGLASVTTPVLPSFVLGSDPGEETLATATDLATRMTVDTHVNGAGPFSFTIDTGSDRSVVSDRLASHLSLPIGRIVTIYGIAGPSSVSTVNVASIRVGQRESRDIAAPVLPERSLGSSGFLGIDAMRDQRVLMDFKHKRITFATSAREAMEGEEGVIVVTGRSRFGQLILTDARVGGIKVHAIIDTGAENTIGNLALRKVMAKRGPIAGEMTTIIGVTGAEMPAEASSIARIRLGGLQLVNMPITYADVRTFALFGIDDKPAILVGMDVLRGFERVAVDFKRREVRFRVGDGAIGQS